MILAISGSLRRGSLNSAALRAAARAAARACLVVELDDSVRSLPQFDPDLDACAPDSVLRLRRMVDAAGGVLLAVPEYTFGIPGALKNALDTTASRSHHATEMTTARSSPRDSSKPLRTLSRISPAAH